MISAAEGHSEAVRLLLDKGADPDARNQFGRTALMFASKYGYTDIVRSLLNHGADVNIVPEDEGEMPALIAATIEGHVAVVKLLLESKADTSIRGRDGRTALMWAEKGRQAEIVNLLRGK